MENDKRHYQVIIVGAGPGGLQLGYCLQQLGVEYLIVDRASTPGSFFSKYPVNRKLLSINKVHTGSTDKAKNLRWDWNSLLNDEQRLSFSSYDAAYFPHADRLTTYLEDFGRQTQLALLMDTSIDRISRSRGVFVLRSTENRELTCDLLVIATGTAIPLVPDIQGVEHVEQYGSYDRSVEACRNKDILILGKGNSAFETADEVLPHAAHVHLLSPSILRTAAQTHFPGHVRQINIPFLDTFLLKQQNAVLNGTVDAIERDGDKLAVSVTWLENGHKAKLKYDRIIACTGFRFDTSVFGGGLEPELTQGGRLPALTYEWESRNVKGLFFCGALMQANDYKKSSTAFVHGMRYCAQTLSRFLMRRLSSGHFPSTAMQCDANLLFNCVYERLRSASSLWHLAGHLCDAYVLDNNSKKVFCLEDVPVRMMAEAPEYRDNSRIEFRFTFDNPEDTEERGKFTPNGLLHPALYFFVEGRYVGERHMYEDIYGEWEQRDKFGGPFKSVLSSFVDVVAAG